MKETLVLFPSPGMGHLVSMVELGKCFLLHQFSIIIITTNPPFNTGTTASYIRSVADSGLGINFIELPPVDLSHLSTATHGELLTFEFLLGCKPLLLQTLKSISQTSDIRALIIDFFCSSALDVATDLQIPAYFFFTSGAGVLAMFLHFPTIHTRIPISFRDLKSDLDFPGIPPVPSDDMPMPMMDRDDKTYDGFLYHSSRMPMGKGIIVNTFESLEPRALKTIRDGLCVPDKPTPPIYTIGPLIMNKDGSDSGAEATAAACLTWLDEQPKSSVVFLCFGSLGLFSAEQIREIAVGLEKSEQRFLWVVRSPPSKDKSKRFLKPPEPDLDVLLPAGFLERTSRWGLVVKSWAPQVAVLNKPSVGGFVTHCGWNSVLESICAGVPMVAWPLYAEQRLNRVLLVKEMQLAFPVDMPEDGFVKAEGVERCVRKLMDSEEGNSMRKRMLDLKESAAAAFEYGGTSSSSLSELAKAWKDGTVHG